MTSSYNRFLLVVTLICSESIISIVVAFSLSRSVIVDRTRSGSRRATTVMFPFTRRRISGLSLNYIPRRSSSIVTPPVVTTMSAFPQTISSKASSTSRRQCRQYCASPMSLSASPSSDEEGEGNVIDDNKKKPTFIHPECTPFQAYYLTRDWDAVTKYWANLLIQDEETWPEFVRGNPTYGLTNIKKLFIAGSKGEFSSTDERYLKRKTFAIRVGYRGDAYRGYQWQDNVDRDYSHRVTAVSDDDGGSGNDSDSSSNSSSSSQGDNRRTVEGDLTKILGVTCFGAGRTDRGVHALSQVVCFGTSYHLQQATNEEGDGVDSSSIVKTGEETERSGDGESENVKSTIIDSFDNSSSKKMKKKKAIPIEDENSGEYFLSKLRASEAWKEGRLRIFQCYRVPKRFHARSSALWRRYLYLFPLSIAEKNKELLIDLNCDAIVGGSNSDTVRMPRNVPDYDIDLDKLNRILAE